MPKGSSRSSSLRAFAFSPDVGLWNFRLPFTRVDLCPPRLSSVSVIYLGRREASAGVS